MTTLGERLRTVRDDVLRESRSGLANKLEVSLVTIQNYENDAREPSATFVVKFAELAAVSIEWLLTGEGAMYKGATAAPAPSHAAAPEVQQLGSAGRFWPNPHGEPQLKAWQAWAAGIDTTLFVPVIYAPKLCAAAGNGVVNYMDEQETEALMFKASFLRYMGVQPHQVFCMRVKGESMKPTLEDGCIVLVDTAQCRVSEGVFVLRMNDELLVKRLQPLPGGVVRVMSDNQTYASFEINLAQLAEHEIDIIGRAIHLNTKI